jgi:glyoxylate/hydroxypyruvate reductase
MNDMTIPFVTSQDPETARRWIQALQAAMPDLAVTGLNDMDPAHKARCTVAIVANPDPADLRQLPGLVWVHSVWAGVERLMADLPPSSPLQVVRLVDPQLARTMAEAVLTATLYLHRDFPAYARQQQRKEWQALDYTPPGDRQVGLLGLGALGEAAAQRLLAAGFKVGGWSRQAKHLPGVRGFVGAAGLGAMLAQTDILVNLLPLTPETRGLIDARALAALPAGASLVNFGRGATVVDGDLRAALDSGHLAHAVLDVFEAEPLPEGAWQWQHPRVTVLPHCSAPTDRGTASAIVAVNIRRYLEDGTVPPGVDKTRGY